MKRYVSLASALLVGTVVANEKKSTVTTLAPKAVEGVSPKALRAAGIMVEAKKPIYASDVSDLDDNIKDVQAKEDQKEKKQSAQSSATSARVAQKKDKKQSAQSSATSARVAIKNDDDSIIDDDSLENDVAKDASVTSSPDEVQRVDSSSPDCMDEEPVSSDDDSDNEVAKIADDDSLDTSVDN